MNPWIIAPILIPAFAATVLVLAFRHRFRMARVVSFGAALATTAVAIGLVVQASAGPPQVYLLGDWPAPFGIVLVLDRLSAAMVLLTSVLSLAALTYAMGGWDLRGRHFHALVQFQLLGINGAFLTGDLFNLFVFFEVLLIASYALLLHGVGAERLRTGVQYVVVNLAASTLLLVGIGMVYGVTGTLNLAHLALRAAEIAPGDRALFQAGGMLVLTAFAVKAAVAPLHFWLPGAYAAAAPPAAALFCILTKVGVVSILRVGTLLFGGPAGEATWLPGAWLLPAALATLALGTAGVLASRDVRGLAAWSTVTSTGTIGAAVAVHTPEASSAALYYVAHSTLATAALFLIAGLLSARRGALADGLSRSPPFAQAGALGALFFAAAVAIVGLPPLSGFIGKLLVLDRVFASWAAPWIWGVVLLSSLLSLMAFARAGSALFWKSDGDPAEAPPAGGLPTLAAAGSLIAAVAAISAAAGPITDYLDAAAAQLFAPEGYVEAVLSARGR
jgi:multicomponent K+:H+ antiporter subunit D